KYLEKKLHSDTLQSQRLESYRNYQVDKGRKFVEISDFTAKPVNRVSYTAIWGAFDLPESET
ncbi:MAG: hypothetical protein AB2784_22535, partial [Candidatus Thiodiazotropha endolucinida]